MGYVAPARQSKQGTNRKRAGGPARIYNAAAAALPGQPAGHSFNMRPLCVAVLGQAVSIPCGLRLDRTYVEAMRTDEKIMNRLLAKMALHEAPDIVNFFHADRMRYRVFMQFWRVTRLLQIMNRSMVSRQRDHIILRPMGQEYRNGLVSCLFLCRQAICQTEVGGKAQHACQRKWMPQSRMQRNHPAL